VRAGGTVGFELGSLRQFCRVEMDYRVSLDMYKGPMDLLLYLIRENEVDIYDIPVAKITDQYVQYLGVLELIDPNVVGDFLVMAATLAEIKSKMLLPAAEQAEDGQPVEDPRMELVRQLMEYKTLQGDGGGAGGNGGRAGASFRPAFVPRRRAGPGSRSRRGQRLGPLPLVHDADEATLGALPRTIIDSDVPVYQHMELIMRMLRAQGIITFLSVFERCKDRVQAVGAFIAVLELTRRQVIGIEQTSAQDEIRIHMRDESRFAELLGAVEEAERAGGCGLAAGLGRAEGEAGRGGGEAPAAAQSQMLTVISTGSENCLFFSYPAAGVETFIDFG